ncbi:MAG: sugar transporter, partial [Rhodobacteraceae bacterium]|nr:sugar transporter [Paracoccaceae bacterium]
MAVKKALPTARPAHRRPRHLFLALFFVVWVIAPLGAVSWYLFGIAEDQYASVVGFSVRKEETGSALEFLGGITDLSGSSYSDTDILYEYIQSQEMVRLVHAKLDMARIYTKPGDPFFSLGDDLRIEALARYWKRMINVYYDNSSGLIEIRVLAFNPRDAQEIVAVIYDQSSMMINQLSTIARADITRYAQEELTRAVERLKLARQARSAFQNRTRIVDPMADISGRMGLLNTLHAQLAETKIEQELLLRNSLSDNDPRKQQIERKLDAIQKLIDEERGQFVNGSDSVESSGEATYSELLAEFEALQVDLEFAEQAYLSAQASHDIALAEAQRKSRYLAAY